MQGKGFIKVIAVLLIAISAYQLLFTWKAVQIENKAKELAEQNIPSGDVEKLFPGDPVAQFQYADSIHQKRIDFKNRYLDSIAPTKVFLWNTFKDVKEGQINLGLDLQGGMSAVLQISIRELLTGLSENNKSPLFKDALDKADFAATKSPDDYITLFAKAYKEVNPNGKLAELFATRSNIEVIKSTSTDAEVLEYIRKESAEQVQRTFNIISTRIDQFGLKQPTVTLEPKKGRITVEIPGVDNPVRVRNMLQATASLEFWETYFANELGASLEGANQSVKLYKEYGSTGTVTNTDSTVAENKDAEASKLLLGDSDSSKAAANDTTLAGQQKKFKEENPLYSILFPAIDNDGRFVQAPFIGTAMQKDTSLINFYLNLPEVKSAFPKNIRFAWDAKPTSDTSRAFRLYALKTRNNTTEPFLNGSDVENSRPDLDQTGETVIILNMKPEGARKWKKLTGANIGRSIAIVVDNQVYSAPTVQGELSGSSQITGNFTQQEATDLSNILKIGKLPASAQIIEEESVGATLGAESIRAGLLSMLVGFVMVVAFMIFFYSSAGLIADIVLLLNLFLIMGILATNSATLTLPGIAGIVLTMGMAVDANVIIYERVKEELQLGKSPALAISEGYKHSYAAILDGNITTLLTGIILFVVGMGPVKGFATTLIIGIITTLFTAVLISRLFVESWLNKKKDLKVSRSFTKNFLQNIHFDFIGKRKITYAISSIIIIAGIISFVTRSFDMGVDFQGGRQYKVRFEQPVNTVEVKSALDKVFNTGTIVKTAGSDNQIKVTTSYLIDKNGKNVDHIVDSTLFAGLNPYLKNGTTFETFKTVHLLSQQKIDPTVSVDIKQSSIWATILSLIVIFLYIFIRFRKVGYSMGAIVSSAHDVFFVLAVFSLLHGILPFSMEVDQSFIAAILTIIGYSLNDTVIIFDRIREYLDKHKKRDMKGIMNDAINSTLSRTFVTGITTLISVIILFIFGGEVLRGFSFAMIIGILIGTYSSIFIAAPIMYDVTRGRRPDEKEVTPEKTK